MPQDDPTQPGMPPRPITPQPQNWRELLRLIMAIFKDYQKQPVKPGYPVCDRCGHALEIAGFTHDPPHKPIWGCPQCN